MALIHIKCCDINLASHEIRSSRIIHNTALLSLDYDFSLDKDAEGYHRPTVLAVVVCRHAALDMPSWLAQLRVGIVLLYNVVITPFHLVQSRHLLERVGMRQRKPRLSTLDWMLAWMRLCLLDQLTRHKSAVAAYSETCYDGTLFQVAWPVILGGTWSSCRFF